MLAAARESAVVASRHGGFVSFTAGIHPHDAAGFDRHVHVRELGDIAATGAVAIGECGLDYHYHNSPRIEQQRAFEAQIELAATLKLPLVVHTRDAETDTRNFISVAEKAGAIGVLHCYTGSHGLAEHAIRSGWYVSFSGIVTFRKWSDDDLIRLVPRDRILAESDAPYLAPVPNRGKRNEPAWVRFTVAKLAATSAISAEEMGRVVIDNTRRLFSLA